MNSRMSIKTLFITWTALIFAPAGSALAQSGVWRPGGPSPIVQGQVESITNREVVGAVHAVAPHPTDPNVAYIGSVNGGVWRTDNAQDASPGWVAQTDQQASLSIGAIEFDPTDANNQTLVAGVGIFSNIGLAFGPPAGGALTGLLRTTDGGATWTPIGAGPLAGTNISGVAARGAIIVVADNIGGIWRSTDTGVNWTQISGLLGSGLPAGPAFDLEGVPGTPARLYTNAGSNGIFVSTDTGATWNAVSTPAMNALAPYGNVRISATAGNVVYVGISRFGQLAGVFRSGNGGANWAGMAIPGTNESDGNFYGIHPGGQAGVNLSMVADPAAANANIVYIGGDRQPGPAGPPAADNFPFPNTVGAQNFTGRLFRGNAGLAAANQFVHLTHSNSQGPAGGGTANRSAPHADSRNMAFDAAGNLIEVDDGGIYRRTSPQDNTGAWQSMNGNLQNTEFHSVAWDAVSNTIIGGAQDVGTSDQEAFEEVAWMAATQADGGAVAVDDISTPGVSSRFFSAQQLFFQGQTQLGVRQFDASDNSISVTTAALTVIGGGAALQPQFYTPVVVNNANGTDMIIGAANSVYESLDGGGTITEIGVGITVNSSLQGEAIGYGAADNVSMLYVGQNANVLIRTGAHPGSLLTQSATYPGFLNVTDIAIDPQDSQTAVVIDSANVFQTTDGGGTWTNITGDLPNSNPGQFRSVDVVRAGGQEAVAVGTDRGVFWADGLPVQEWSEPCVGLPNAPVVDLEFDEADEVLLAGTLGRGAWTCSPAQPGPSEYNVKFFCGRGDGEILGAGEYTTAINIMNRDRDDAAPSEYRRSFSLGLPGENAAGQTARRRGAVLAPGEAVEIDCEDIFLEARRLCPDGLCKGFANIESRAPLEVVAVYGAADPETGQVEGIHSERVSGENERCAETELTVPAQKRLFVPRHVRGDREFDGHGPCVRFALDLGTEDDGTALVARYRMHAFECASNFSMPQSDFTAAEGEGAIILALAGPGGRILGYSTSSHVEQDYIDSNHSEDPFTFPDPSPVAELRFTGDTSGDESGRKTGVVISLRTMEVRMQSCAVPGGGN